MPLPRVVELNRRRSRRKKLSQLRRRYREARTQDQKEKVLAKLSKIAPGVTL
ncbi:MAG: DUF6800 family protein [Candidatus Binatia bacterium]